ncbi:hypothetical protein LguiB_005872 [Lonicera macranthoides]
MSTNQGSSSGSPPLRLSLSSSPSPSDSSSSVSSPVTSVSSDPDPLSSLMFASTLTPLSPCSILSGLFKLSTDESSRGDGSGVSERNLVPCYVLIK